MPSIVQILLLLFIVFVVFVPPILVLISKRTQGGAKFGWFVGAVLFSWLGYIAFIITTNKKLENQSAD